MELKSGGGVSPAEIMKLSAAARALQALLEADEPQKSTPEGEKSLLSPVIEALEKPVNAGKPQSHLLGPIIEALENPKKE